MDHVGLFARSTFEELVDYFFRKGYVLNLMPSTSPNWGGIPRWPQPPSPQPQKELFGRETPAPSPQPPAPKGTFRVEAVCWGRGILQVLAFLWSNKVSLVSCQGHFATLPIHVAPSFCARLLTAVSLGPPGGATTHHQPRSISIKLHQSLSAFIDLYQSQ